MAIVPMTGMVLLIATLLNSDALRTRLELTGNGAALSTAVRSEMDRSGIALLFLSADPALVTLSAQPAVALPAASGSVRALADLLGDPARGANLLDRAQRVVLPLWSRGEVGFGAAAPADARARALLRTTSTLLPGEIHRSEPYPGADGETWVTLATPLTVAGSTPSTRLVSLDLSLTHILGSVQPLLGSGSRTAQLVDEARGAVIAEVRGDGPSGGGLESALAEVTGAQPISEEIALPGMDGWLVRITDDSVPNAPPYAIIGLLGALGVLLAGLTYWMSRQIIRPAEDLERSRAELDELYRKARSASLHDALTGLGNHRAFQEEFDRQIDQATRYGADMSLLLIDLDDFKLVNDSAGHAVGDQLLAELGRLIHSTVRRSDRAFRTGGDEFAVLMPHTDAEAAYTLARRLLAGTLAPQGATGFGRPFSFSAGISSCPSLGQKRNQLYAQADAALYSCKRHGRTAIEVFDPDRNKVALDPAAAVELSRKVADVAARRALRPVYQPIVDLGSGRILGYEGLIRPGADSGFPDAGRLFEAAEGSGRTIELDQACLEAVVAGAAGLGADQILTLNVSPRTLEAPEFSAAGLLATITRYGISPERAVLELTEREGVENLDRLRRNLAACQSAGIRIAADDVGAGNAGLRLLSQIHFDIVKIDLSLVQGGALRESSLAVLRSLRDLASRWGAMVIAEGVENAHQLSVLRELGITAAQGYLLGRPGDRLDLPTVDLDRLVSDTEEPTPVHPHQTPRATAA
jgi:diguanylate cyclase (GGDEF)-like protein